MAVPTETRDRLIARPVVITNRRRASFSWKGFFAGFATSTVICLLLFGLYIWYYKDSCLAPGHYHCGDVDGSETSTTTEGPITKSRFQEIDLRGFNGLSDLEKKTEKPKEDDREDSRFLSRPSRHLKPTENSTTCQKRIVSVFDLRSTDELTDKQLSMLTHIIFYPMEVHSNGTITLKDDTQKKKFDRLVKQAKSFDVKVMFSTVELMTDEIKMEEIIVDGEKRKNLLHSILNIIQSYNLDGVDVHWRWSYTAEHQDNLILLCKELREQLTNIATKTKRSTSYVIGVATGLRIKDPKIKDVLEFVDFVNLESSQYYGHGYGGFGEAVGPSQPLTEEQFFIDMTLKYYTNLTETPDKLNLVIRFHKTRTGFNEEADREKMEKKGFSSKDFLKHLENKAWSVETSMKDLREKLDDLADKNLGGLTIWRMQNDLEDDRMMKMVMEKKCAKTE